MPSVKEELEALRKQSLAKTHASKLKDAGGLSTPEQEEAQIKDFNEKKRLANYTKEAKQTLSAGTKAVDQDLEFKRQLAAAKKQDKEKTHAAKQTLAAGTKAVDKTLEFQQQSIAMKRADGLKKKEAAENLAKFNSSFSKKEEDEPAVIAEATAPETTTPTEEPETKTTPVAAPTPKETTQAASTPAAVASADNDVDDDDDNVPVLEEIDDIPTLEEMPQTDSSGVTMPGMPTDGDDMAAAGGPRVQNRAEKKARKLMERLNMRAVTGISRVTLKATGNQGFFTIQQPDVYEKNGSYIVFGEARQGTGMLPSSSSQQQQQAKAAQQLAAASAAETNPAAAAAAAAVASPTVEPIQDQEEPDVDETGIDAKDVELVIQQAGCSRAKAVAALKENDGDLVNAIMALTK